MIKFLSLMMFVLSAFSLSADSDEIILEVGLQAFEKTLYPRLRQSCTKCHGDGGIAVGHSVSDVRQAYLNSKQLADFNSVESSRFVSKVRAKHWLKHDSTQMGMSEEEMVSLIKNWWNQGESQAHIKFELTSELALIPTQLPEMKDNSWEPMELKVNQEGLPSCVARVDIQRARHGTENHPGSYRVKNLRITCSQDMEIQGVYLAVSNELHQYENIYAPIKKIVKSNKDEMLSSEVMILIQRQAQDTLTLLARRAKAQ